MGTRSLQASQKGIEKAKIALAQYSLSQNALADDLGLSRHTVNNFFKGKSIDRGNFALICDRLELELENTAVIIDSPSHEQPCSIDELVKMIRLALHDPIQVKCGSMRVLDMTQPINLNAIYTTVNILEKITGRRRLGLADLLQGFSLEDFERFGLSKIQEARVPGLEAADKYAKLMILGKPGSGKTTFLKHVALRCIEGTFKSNVVPFFITLKDFAEAPDKTNLLEYLIQTVKDYGIETDTKIKPGILTLLSGNPTSVELLLRQGRILLLLDGLDEVKESDSDWVLRQIQNFTNRFPKNFFIITCRIATREYTFERFIEVEIADFDEHQIEIFATQWFRAKNTEIKAKLFIEKLRQQRGIQELATSPLLLTLLCLVFEESGNFPTNRSELYEEGLDILLKKWDTKRNIDRDSSYQQLSLQQKEDLLSQVAFETFDKGSYFFKQKEAERAITKYICSLSALNNIIDNAKLQLDSEAILKSIEAQHGLFVERARGIYSFSHLTFHEYFTARTIVTTKTSKDSLNNLLTHLFEKRWREIFLITVWMLENADDLLIAMKQQIDHLLATDEKLQRFLTWITEKARSVQPLYKPAAIRAFYMALDSDTILEPNLDHIIDSTFDLNHAQDIVLDHAFCRARSIALSRARDIAHARALALNYEHDDIDPARLRAFARDHALSGEGEFDPSIIPRIRKVAITLDLSRDNELAIDLNRTLTLDIDPTLQQSIQRLKDQLPNLQRDWNDRQEWWQANGSRWIEQLQTLILEQRNIGHNWKLSDSEKKKVQQYYDANKLLASCLNNDCCINPAVRQEIEDGLLLPISEIEERFPNQRRQP